MAYNNASSRFYGKKVAVCVGATDLMPVIKMNNIDYSGDPQTYEPGRYAMLICSQAIAEPTVNDIDAIYFPSSDGTGGISHVYGVEGFLRTGFTDSLFQGEEITETSQLITVGAYDNLAQVPENQSDILITMEAGFAAEFFE